jgi:hypothetical protein
MTVGVKPPVRNDRTASLLSGSRPIRPLLNGDLDVRRLIEGQSDWVEISLSPGTDLPLAGVRIAESLK